MILYIAGPMTGLPDLNYPQFRDVAGRLQALGFDVLDPSTIDEQFPLKHDDGCEVVMGDGGAMFCECGAIERKNWQWYMRKAVGMLAEADGVALLRGWERSRGASAEVALAKALEIPCQMWFDWAAQEARRQRQAKDNRRKA